MYNFNFNEIVISVVLLIFNLLYIKNFQKIHQWLSNYDFPDKNRKIHNRTTFTSGGALLASNLFLYYVFIKFYPENAHFLLSNNFITISSLLIFLIGYYDDKINISPLYKFFFIMLVLTIATHQSTDLQIKQINFSFLEKKINTNEYSLILTVLCLCLFIHALNLFDGINLQVGFYSFLLIIYLCSINNKFYFIGYFFFYPIFLYLNWKKKIFLGDSGSLLIATIIGYMLIINNNQESKLYADQIFLLLSIPGIDMLRIFIIRCLELKNPFKPDNKHLHHIIIANNSFLYTFTTIQLLIWIPFVISLYKTKLILVIIIFQILIYFLIIFSNTTTKKIIK
jgi:UDP-GlcNAc:undecaprenyl-phosphate GlcNAc-1-phosphate transferase